MNAVTPSWTSCDFVDRRKGALGERPADVVRRVGGTEHDLAGLADGEWGIAANLLREVDRGGPRPALAAQDVDQAEPLGGRGLDRLTGQRHLHGDVERDLAPKPEEPARFSHQAARDLGEAEPGRGGRHDQVAGEDDLGATRQRGTLHRGDDRLGPLTPHEPGETATLRREPPGVAGAHLLEVRAGTEHRRLRREHGDPDVVCLLDAVDGRLDAARHVGVDRVACPGARDRDHRDLLVDLQRDELGHRLGRRLDHHSDPLSIVGQRTCWAKSGSRFSAKATAPSRPSAVS